jgi:hypothetical protein
MRVIAAILTAGFVMPIWYYLLYQILTRVGATELMWFLFWVYVPANFAAQVLFKTGSGK